jgi:hypothetical protein
MLEELFQLWWLRVSDIKQQRAGENSQAKTTQHVTLAAAEYFEAEARINDQARNWYSSPHPPVDTTPHLAADKVCMSDWLHTITITMLLVRASNLVNVILHTKFLHCALHVPVRMLQKPPGCTCAASVNEFHDIRVDMLSIFVI